MLAFALATVLASCANAVRPLPPPCCSVPTFVCVQQAGSFVLSLQYSSHTIDLSFHRCCSYAQVQLPSTPFPASITDYYIHLDANGKPTNGSNSLPLSTYPYNVTGNQPEQVILAMPIKAFIE